MFIQETVDVVMWIWVRVLSSVLNGRSEWYSKYSFHICFSCQKIKKTIVIVWKQVDESEMKLPVYEYFQLDQIVFTRIYKSTIPEIHKSMFKYKATNLHWIRQFTNYFNWIPPSNSFHTFPQIYMLLFWATISLQGLTYFSFSCINILCALSLQCIAWHVMKFWKQ